MSNFLINIRFMMAFRAQGLSLSHTPFFAPFLPLIPAIPIVLGTLMFVSERWATTQYDVSSKKLVTLFDSVLLRTARLLFM